MTYLRFKYVICPGYVRSMNDLDHHFIGAGRLMRLYGVAPSECIVLYQDRASDVTTAHWIEREHPEIIFLHPNTYGDYTVY
jgi:hypothetical protein